MRIPSLDGLRAIAIILVIYHHWFNDHGFFGFYYAGDLGVRIFFVLSGFLITSLLLRESNRSGMISLKRFYYRRTLRIFPALYTYLAIMLLLSYIGWSNMTVTGALPALTFTRDYWTLPDQSASIISHTWTLSVEEQFYLIWPALLVLSGRRLAPYVLLFLVLMSPTLRTAVYFVTRSTDQVGSPHFNFDHIGMGCLLAFVRCRLHAWPSYLRLLRSSWFVLTPVFILIAGGQGNHPSIHAGLLLFLINVAIAACVDRVITIDDDWAGRLLNLGFIAWIGRLSYSLYIWQQPFTHLHGETPALNVAMNDATAFAMIFVCAIASHYLVERPFLRLRDSTDSPAALSPPTLELVTAPRPDPSGS